MSGKTVASWRALLFASLLFAILAPLSAAGGGGACITDLGAYVSGSGTCGPGTYDFCDYLDTVSEGCTSCSGSCTISYGCTCSFGGIPCGGTQSCGEGEISVRDGTFTCGGTDTRDCSDYENNYVGCTARGCAWTPAEASCVGADAACGPSSTPYGLPCCTGSGFCVQGETYTCQSCIPKGSSTACGSDDDCCQGNALGSAERSAFALFSPAVGKGSNAAQLKVIKPGDEPIICKTDNRRCEACSADAQHCGANSDCCGGLCDISKQKCASCLSENGRICASDADCCGGLECDIGNGKCVVNINLPPYKPATPAIASAELPAYPLTTIGHAACTANCPPSPLPVDQDSPQDAAMQYLWLRNGAAVGAWGDYAPFDCAANGCAFNDQITLKSRACDTQAACTESDASAALTVQYAPPSAPANLSLVPLGTALTVKTSAHCSGCPPSTAPIDAVTGNPAKVEYSWVRNSAEEEWTTAYADYSCLSKGCNVGDTLLIKMRACNSANPVLCTSEILSNELTVSEAVAGLWGTDIDLQYCVYALAAAISALALAFMASYVFSLPHIRPIIQDEGLQVLATGAVLLSIVGVNAFIDGYMVSALGVATGGSTPYAGITNAMDAAAATLSGMEGKATTMYSQFESTSNDLGREASKGIFCSFLGVGFSLVNCSPLNAFRGSITTAAFATSAALADVYAQQALLSLARNAAFAFLIPLGLFFRCFKTSRGAGGALIAIGFGFYTAYPIMIVATDKLLHGSNYSTPAGMPSVETCDPAETNVGTSKNQVMNYASALTDFGRAENLAYIVLVRTIFASILNLIITLGFIRAFAHVLGSEIDVSALARIS